MITHQFFNTYQLTINFYNFIFFYTTKPYFFFIKNNLTARLYLLKLLVWKKNKTNYCFFLKKQPIVFFSLTKDKYLFNNNLNYTLNFSHVSWFYKKNNVNGLILEKTWLFNFLNIFNYKNYMFLYKKQLLYINFFLFPIYNFFLFKNLNFFFKIYKLKNLLTLNVNCV